MTITLIGPIVTAAGSYRTRDGLGDIAERGHHKPADFLAQHQPMPLLLDHQPALIRGTVEYLGRDDGALWAVAVSWHDDTLYDPAYFSFAGEGDASGHLLDRHVTGIALDELSIVEGPMCTGLAPVRAIPGDIRDHGNWAPPGNLSPVTHHRLHQARTYLADVRNQRRRTLTIIDDASVATRQRMATTTMATQASTNDDDRDVGRPLRRFFADAHVHWID